MNLPKNLTLKAEEIEELKRQNQLIIKQNQLLAERNQKLTEQNHFLAKQMDEKWGQIEIRLLDMHIMIQKLSLMRLRLYQILWKLQESLLRQKYLTTPCMKADIEENQRLQKLSQERIQELENQLTDLLTTA